MNTQREAWIALNLMPGMGPALFHRLLTSGRSAEDVFLHPEKILQPGPGVKPGHIDALKGFDWRQAAEKEMLACEKSRARILTLLDAEYPLLLRNIPNAPPVIYFQGDLSVLSRPTLAVVGSRRPSAYGLEVTGELVAGCVHQGMVIVSGLARGIDARAHEIALKEKGLTVAVLAHGLNLLYPPEHRSLKEKIISQGAVVSEFPMGVQPLPQNFPRRNRIISGLSRGVLVVEAAEKSGALITAHWAVEQGRDVFAVPGPVAARLSQGTNQLIQAGAKLVASAADIVEEWNLDKKPVSKPRVQKSIRPAISLTPEQQAVQGALQGKQRHIDELAMACGWPVQNMMAELFQLELQGLVQSKPGQVYQWMEE